MHQISGRACALGKSGFVWRTHIWTGHDISTGRLRRNFLASDEQLNGQLTAKRQRAECSAPR